MGHSPFYVRVAPSIGDRARRRWRSTNTAARWRWPSTLLALGHRRIGVVAGAKATSPRRSAWSHFGEAVAGKAELIVHRATSPSPPGSAAGAALLGSEERPTAILRGQRFQGRRGDRRGERLGLRVPWTCRSPGSTIPQSAHFIGRRYRGTQPIRGAWPSRRSSAFGRAGRRAERPRGRIELPFELIVRQSTGPARGLKVFRPALPPHGACGRWAPAPAPPRRA